MLLGFRSVFIECLFEVKNCNKFMIINVLRTVLVVLMILFLCTSSCISPLLVHVLFCFHL